MISPEKPIPFSFDSDKEFALEDIRDDVELQLSGEGIRYQADFLGSIATLVEALQESPSPERMERVFHFPATFLPESYYPERLQERLYTRDLNGILLTIVKNANELASTTLEFIDDDGRLHISRAPEGNKTARDWLIPNKGEPQPVERIDDQEINYVLMYLAGIEALQPDDNDVLPEIVPIEWLASISQRAPFSDINAAHTLASGRRVQYSATKTEEKLHPQTCSIYYETGTPGRELEMELDTTQGLSVKFYALDDEGRTPFIADVGDFIRLKEIIESEIEGLNDKRKTSTVDITSLTEDAINLAQERNIP